MKSTQVVLNNLLFEQAHQQGELQLGMLHQINSLGIKNAELRREYFNDINAETPAIANYVSEQKMTLFYSVPEDLFKAGNLNPALIEYFQEAKKLGVQYLKFNIGEFEAWDAENIHQIQNLLSMGMAVNIENNQTPQAGRIEVINKFMQATEKAGVNIGYVYDLGNWRYVGQDEIKAAEQLAAYVRYIHVKDGFGTYPNATTVTLGHGEIDWQKVLEILPKKIPVALEYPTNSSDEIEEGIELLDKWEAK
ncbi:sugar phosphate isomerase/epimerase family protein [Weissella kandleri]|uniref:sugar phosphate isomerase/epimerase family protein n=1 Tax=Weissella kandleri TaxID=1616 RepID=UPI00387E7653